MASSKKSKPVEILDRLLSRRTNADWMIVYERFPGGNQLIPLHHVQRSKDVIESNIFFPDKDMRRVYSHSMSKMKALPLYSSITKSGYEVFALPLRHSVIRRHFLVVFGKKQRKSSLQIPFILEKIPKITDQLIPLSRHFRTRAARLGRGLLSSIREECYQTVSLRRTLHKALVMYAEFTGVQSLRLHLTDSRQCYIPTFVSFDADPVGNPEVLHNLFRKLMETTGNGFLSLDRFPDISAEHQRGLYMSLSNNSYQIHMLIIPGDGNRTAPLHLALLRLFFSELSHFFSQTIPVHLKARELSFEKELFNCIENLTRLRHLEDFLSRLPKILNDYIHADATAFFILDKNEEMLFRHSFAGKIRVAPPISRRSLHQDSFLTQCARSRKVMLRTALNPADIPKIHENSSFSSLLYFPLKDQDELLGVIKIADQRSGSLSFHHLHRLTVLEPFLLNLFRNSDYLSGLTQQLFRDFETGLYNRRGFEDFVDRYLKQAKKSGKIFSVVVMSIDHSSQIFSSLSSLSHRKMLRKVSDQVTSLFPEGTVVGYSGEETFHALVPEHDLSSTLKLSSEFCGIYQRLGASKKKRISFSIGVSAFPINGLSVEQLMSSADQALTISRYQGGSTASIMGSEVLRKLSLEAFSGLMGQSNFKTGPELLDGVLEKISAQEKSQQGLTFLEVINSLVAAIDAKDHYTGNHTMETSILSVALARRMGLDELSTERLRIAARLHDVGKIGIPEHILCKEDTLEESEMNLMRKHPEIGAKILRPISSMDEIADIVEYHHERWDGSGYPHRLRQNEIPLESRILAVVDTYHAMISNRTYREGISPDVVLEELTSQAGTQFDPVIIRHFVQMMQERDSVA